MKPQALATLALRVLAIFVASRSFIYIASMATVFLTSPQNTSEPLWRGLASLWMLGPLIVAVAIWWTAPWLARRASRGMDREPLAGLDADALVNAAFMVAGVLIFLLAVPDLVMLVLRVWNMPHLPGQPQLYPYSDLTAAVLRLLFGIVLALGSRGISRFVLWLRYAGSSGANRSR